jgi:hypothetical protein
MTLFRRKRGDETRLARSSKPVPEAGEQLAEAALELPDRVHPED